MSIIFGAMVPHPPLIIPEVGRGQEAGIADTVASYQEVGRKVAELEPDTIVISTPHSVMYYDYFHISPGATATGDFTRFGVSPSDWSMTVDYDEGKTVDYTFSQLDELELAYAVTIHKSQGSEYPAVIMPLLGGPKQLLNRNLLYTGITRAKRCVTILGSEDTVTEMIQNGSARKRYTGLLARIREAKAGI